MNKKIFGFVFVFLTVLFITKTSFASSLSIKEVTSSSAAIEMKGATPGAVYSITLIKNKGIAGNKAKDYYWAISVTADKDGYAKASFVGLSPDSYYAASYRLDKTGSPIIEVITVKTLVDVNTKTDLEELKDIARIVKYSPVEGKVGDIVTIEGENLNGISEILFGTTKAISKTSNSAEITVAVPTGAKTGPITIKTIDYGNAVSGGDFKVIVPTSGSSTSSDTTDTDNINNSNDEFIGGIVPKCNTGEVDKNTGQYKNPCGFTYFFELINNVIRFMLFTIATPLVALILMYTGYLYLTAGGNAGQTEKAKHIILSVVVGYVVALGAWLLVNAILSAFNLDSSINTFLKK